MNQQLTTKEIVGYGLGDTAANLFLQMFNYYLMIYYTDVFGIPAAMAGLVIIITRAIDTCTDTVIGIIADRTRTRWGRFRPYMLWGALPFGLAGILAFTTPDLGSNGKILWAFFTYSLLMLMYTFVNIPYNALMSVLTSDINKRLKVSSYKFVFAYLGGIIVTLFAKDMIEALGGRSEKDGYQYTAIIFGAVAVILTFVSFLSTLCSHDTHNAIIEMQQMPVLKMKRNSTPASPRVALTMLYPCLIMLLLIQTLRVQGQSGITGLGREVYQLSTGNVALQVDAGYGGRIISLKINEKEYLTGKDVHPENFGSTLWLSPQRDWGWPPAPALDIEPYKARLNGNELQLKSRKDLVSGYQVSKVFKGNDRDTTIQITYQIKNISQGRKNVAAWEVTRVRAEGLSFFAKESDKPVHGSNVDIADTLSHIWYSFDPQKVTNSQKLFMNGKGWLAHLNSTGLLIKKFPDIRPEDAAPIEEEIEIYVNNKKDYIELENQGPYTTLEPGQSITWTVTWVLRTPKEELCQQGPSSELLQYVNSLITR